MNHPSVPKRRRSPAALAAILLSVFALTVALSSTATAALMVGSNQIKKNAVKSKHIKKNAVTTSDIKNGTIKSRDLSAATRNGLAGPQGEKGEKGDRGLTGFGLKGDQGDPGISDYQQVDTTMPVAANSNFQVIAECPSGTMVLGGGYYANNTADIQVDRPRTGSPSGWIVSGKTIDASTIMVWAICAVVAN